MCWGNTAAHSSISLLPKWRKASYYNFSSKPHTPHFLVRAAYSSFSRSSSILLIFSFEQHTSHFLVPHALKFLSFPLLEILICRTSFTNHIYFFVWENLMYYVCPNMARFSNNIFICKEWTFKKEIIGRTRIPRWLGRENDKNVARNRNCYG